MIKVLYVVFASNNFDGATYSLMDLIQALKGKIEPIILLPEKGCVYDEFQRLNVECIIHKFEPDLCTDPKTLKQYIGYIARYIPFKYRYYSINHQCIHSLKNKLKDKHIDIVHSNSTVLTIGYDIAKALNANFVWHLREFLNSGLGLKPLTNTKAFKYKLMHTDAIIGITDSVLHHYLGTNLTNSYSIFDAVRHRGDIVWQKEKDKYFLFCAGIVIPAKRCDIAVTAFRNSDLWKNGYKLRIIGKVDGIYGEKLMQHVYKSGVGEYIDFIPFTTDVKQHMEKATALLMCSDCEGMGRVTVEAMFYGCPVIGRNTGGTKDFIFNNRTGFLFDTVEQCSNIMKYVAHHNCEHIIQEAQLFAVNNFAIEDYGNKIMTVYNDILSKANFIV